MRVDYVQLASAFLELEDAPLNLREALFGVGSQDADRANQLIDLDLSLELVKTALEHAISCRLLAAAPATGARQSSLEV